MSTHGKYMISVDIEGISGIATPEFSNPDGKQYAQARKLMSWNTNAVIEGILEADSNAQIIVRDAHCHATNLLFEDLHPAVSLIQGWGNSVNMIQGVDNTFDGIFLVGYHAGGSNRGAVLSHTLSTGINWIKVNGKIVNEAGWAGVLAGHYDVPIAFLSGDDQATLEAQEQFDHIETVAVKQSMGRDCTLSYPLSTVSKQLKETACRAVHNLTKKQVPPFKVKTPMEVAVKFYDTGYLKSNFQSIYELLNFDETYQCNHDEESISFQAKSQLEAFQKFMIVFGLYRATRN